MNQTSHEPKRYFFFEHLFQLPMLDGNSGIYSKAHPNTF